jgi:hypothetical protein
MAMSLWNSNKIATKVIFTWGGSTLSRLVHGFNSHTRCDSKMARNET